MQATRFEFEQRFWVIGAIFFVGFSLTWLDHTPFTVGLIRLLAPAVAPDSPRETELIRAVLFAAAALIFLAALIRTWATAYLRTEVVHDARQHSDRLLADGPYRHFRNPLYFAVILMTAGIATMASRAGWCFLVPAITIFLYRLILREESGLLAAHGDSYRNYLKTVPRMFPSPWPRIPAGNTRPRWGQAFAGELFFWLIGAAMLTFAITLDQRIAGIVFLASFPVYFLSVALVKRRAKQEAN